MDDQRLRERFDRMVGASSDGLAPTVTDLEGRIQVRRTARRRTQRRLATAGCFVVIALVALAASLVARSSDDDASELATDPSVTALPVDDDADPVLTLDVTTDGLAYQRCSASNDPATPNAVDGITCSYDNPGTAQADGLTITRALGRGTPEVLRAWDERDAAAVAMALGATDDPATARFRSLGDATVLDVSVAGRPSDDALASLYVRVGDDLLALNATNVPLDALRTLVADASLAPPSMLVAEALRALPPGSVALLQGVRPLVAQPDPLQPERSAPFGGTTTGAELAVPGDDQLVSVDITAGIGADALLDSILAEGDPGTSEQEIGGRRAVVVAPTGALPRSVPEPRFGPQIIVRLSDTSVVRISQPDGDAELVRTVAESLS